MVIRARWAPWNLPRWHQFFSRSGVEVSSFTTWIDLVTLQGSQEGYSFVTTFLTIGNVHCPSTVRVKYSSRQYKVAINRFYVPQAEITTSEVHMTRIWQWQETTGEWGRKEWPIYWSVGSTRHNHARNFWCQALMRIRLFNVAEWIYTRFYASEVRLRETTERTSIACDAPLVTKADVEKALKGTKREKVACEDGINVDLVKLGGDIALQKTAALFLGTLKAPAAWKHTTEIVINKKGTLQIHQPTIQTVY